MLVVRANHLIGRFGWGRKNRSPLSQQAWHVKDPPQILAPNEGLNFVSLHRQRRHLHMNAIILSGGVQSTNYWSIAQGRCIWGTNSTWISTWLSEIENYLAYYKKWEQSSKDENHEQWQELINSKQTVSMIYVAKLCYGILEIQL